MSTVEQAIKDIKAGKFVIVVDDKDRENEGDLIIAADKVTPQAIAFMVRYTTGIICTSLTGEQLDKLKIPLMVTDNTESQRTPFTVSVDCKNGISTGVSASDRSATIQALASPDSEPGDFCRPGHIFPLRYREGGVLKRAGHTEAAVDLATLAGLSPAGVLSEIVNEDGSMARLPELEIFALEHKLSIITVADIIRHRRHSEKLVKFISKARLPTEYGDFIAHVYESILDGEQHIAIVKGEISKNDKILVRVHSECLTGDVFESRRCDCGQQLKQAMKLISDEGTGVIVYLRGHEGRGIGLGHKIRAYGLQDGGKDTVEANVELGLPVDSREYGIGAQILVELGIKKIRLLTNNPAKYTGLSGYDLEIVDRVPLVSNVHKDNIDYLKTKQSKLGHIIDFTNKNSG
ncbi:MAG TPA: bifunctional 3,4-dihydroxy-2-butanone-4-phosphate synthase/GTP cyclohydrolase II [Parachlamydiaceae bacterium]|nr:bifunctional 3,4-dihydroxy-2-butanone-4-phosphate synthase/GTP cyclohydrolase II [Parachlamydiaceae bacterium]